jgi:hypothetical protein
VEPKSGDISNGSYRCFVRTSGGVKYKCVVGAPAHLDHAVDSPEAFDGAARAALAFAEHDGVSVYPIWNDNLSEIELKRA